MATLQTVIITEVRYNSGQHNNPVNAISDITLLSRFTGLNN